MTRTGEAGSVPPRSVVLGAGHPDATILFVDDESDLRELVELTVTRMGHRVRSAASVGEACALMDAQSFNLCLTDMRLPDGDGLAVLRHAGQCQPDMPVAVLTAYGNTENAVAALKAGAFDYLSKPVALEDLRALIGSALRLPAAGAQPASVRGTLLGDSPPMVQVRQLIARLSKSQAPVYITGESGSGKELAARLLHEGGARRDGPFVPVNCGAIPESLMDSEFFGYRKGAFTGASEDRDGFFHAASGGTLFLDEVADLPLAMQVKLLRVIQEKRVRKVGATTEDPVDVRVISATHQNLQTLVDAGRFRQDLYYRLAVIDLRMPALRECPADIPGIARAILDRIVAGSAQPPSLSGEALERLAQYRFPGNVRELENILERAVALASGPMIGVGDLHLLAGDESGRAAEAVSAEADAGGQPGQAPTGAAGLSSPESVLATMSGDGPGDDLPELLPAYLDRVEREAILAALARTSFNRTRAAALLGISFRALRYRMERLGIREGE
jgi:two-component system response regulator PilR (NtrC family)